MVYLEHRWVRVNEAKWGKKRKLGARYWVFYHIHKFGFYCVSWSCHERFLRRRNDVIISEV